uniref:Snaclec rhodocetin subunit beta n=1 Tax=Calloselasma rhodostoma TaxID=8717 RepID=SLEB_CALRH|nr:RecName: Full=Snaclec rhodocetin subunit beta [Calloselasma rhodostoma]1SB2_B Chain B, Rhodocetin beta subunit [Calloselasma rhodostoma]3GPR_B Chain B, Rhodocetin subunit beta [Calloselasma rhodostoma]
DFRCPTTWSASKLYCYKPFKEKKTWIEAERFCAKQAENGHLVSIGSAAEADFLDLVIVVNFDKQRYRAWTGLTERNLKWTNGASVSYENLYEPYIRKCFVVQPWEGKSKWYKADCEEKNAFLCKFPKPH